MALIKSCLEGTSGIGDFLPADGYLKYSMGEGPTIGTYTSGTAISLSGAFGKTIMFNVKGKSGNISVGSGSTAQGGWKFMSVTNGVAAEIGTPTAGTSRSGSFSDIDYLIAVEGSNSPITMEATLTIN